MIFSLFKKKIGFLGIFDPPYCGTATIRIGREMLCLPYAGFFFVLHAKKVNQLNLYTQWFYFNVTFKLF